MWYTTRYEGFDSPIRSCSPPALYSMFHVTLSVLLRSGFLLKLIGLTGLILTYLIYNGGGFFTYDLTSLAEADLYSGHFRCFLTLFQFIQLFGSLHLLCFQATVADDVSCPRGYRSGSKMLGVAVAFDMISNVMQFVVYLYMSRNDKAWWEQVAFGGGLEWLFLTLARTLNACSLFFYANGLFLLEVYHDDGTSDALGLLNASIFSIAGVAEILSFVNGAISVIIQWTGLVSALVWAMGFEPVLNLSQPVLYETELVSEVEKDVGKFPRLNVREESRR